MQFFRVLVSTSIVLLFVSCGNNESPLPVPAQPGQVVVPRAASGVFLSEDETQVLSIQNEETETPPRVALGEEFLLISTVDANLDLDEPEEQILLVKRRDDPEDRIRVLVTDFDTLRNTHRVTWQGETTATNVRTFALYVRDLIGDHVNELVCFGTDNQGLQTLDVFRRDPSPASSGLAFRQILQITTDASIEIEDRPRSDAYRSLQSNGISFPVLSFRRNPATDAPLDLIKTSYYWRVQQGRYVAELEEEIPGVVVEESQLRELYDGEVTVIERFLEGPWYRASGSDIGSDVEMAYFSTQDREIVLFRSGAQERYLWQNSYKSLYEGGPGVWMNLKNEILQRVRRQMSITVLGLDSIFVSVDDAEYWTGRYQRMTPGLQNAVVQNSRTINSEVELIGVFRNENNEEIVFSEPFFTLRTEDIQWHGGYNVFQADELVLELKIISDNGEERSFSRSFFLEVQEEGSDDQTVRRLTLKPAEITINGVQSVPGRDYVLEQVEREN